MIGALPELSFAAAIISGTAFASTCSCVGQDNAKYVWHIISSSVMRYWVIYLLGWQCYLVDSNTCRPAEQLPLAPRELLLRQWADWQSATLKLVRLSSYRDVFLSGQDLPAAVAPPGCLFFSPDSEQASAREGKDQELTEVRDY